MLLLCGAQHASFSLRLMISGCYVTRNGFQQSLALLLGSHSLYGFVKCVSRHLGVLLHYNYLKFHP